MSQGVVQPFLHGALTLLHSFIKPPYNLTRLALGAAFDTARDTDLNGQGPRKITSFFAQPKSTLSMTAASTVGTTAPAPAPAPSTAASVSAALPCMDGGQYQSACMSGGQFGSAGVGCGVCSSDQQQAVAGRSDNAQLEYQDSTSVSSASAVATMSALTQPLHRQPADAELGLPAADSGSISAGASGATVAGSKDVAESETDAVAQGAPAKSLVVEQDLRQEAPVSVAHAGAGHTVAAAPAVKPEDGQHPMMDAAQAATTAAAAVEPEGAAQGPSGCAQRTDDNMAGACSTHIIEAAIQSPRPLAQASSRGPADMHEMLGEASRPCGNPVSVVIGAGELLQGSRQGSLEIHHGERLSSGGCQHSSEAVPQRAPALTASGSRPKAAQGVVTAELLRVQSLFAGGRGQSVLAGVGNSQEARDAALAARLQQEECLRGASRAATSVQVSVSAKDKSKTAVYGRTAFDCTAQSTSRPQPS